MVSSQLLIAEIGTEIRDRIVKDGCHVQAVLLRPRPGRRETIFGKDLGKQDPDGILHDGMTLGGGTGMRSRRYGMPTFLYGPVELPQLLEFLLRGKQDPDGILHDGMPLGGGTGMRSRRYGMPTFLYGPVELPQLLEFLLRGKHICPKSTVAEREVGTE